MIYDIWSASGRMKLSHSLDAVQSGKDSFAYGRLLYDFDEEEKSDAPYRKPMASKSCLFVGFVI